MVDLELGPVRKAMLDKFVVTVILSLMIYLKYNLNSIKSNKFANYQVYCCLGSLAIADCLEMIDIQRTARWLAERQCRSGGLNGAFDFAQFVCFILLKSNF